MIRLSIIEPNAHLAGHYSGELFHFCLQIRRFGVRTSVITPFGVHDPWPAMEDCEVRALLPTGLNPTALHDLYQHQWKFYRRVAEYLRQAEPDLIHVWGYRSVFPLWWNLRRVHQPKVITLKAVRRPHRLCGSALLGAIQEKLSLRLLAGLGDHYIVHTPSLQQDAIAIGIASRKISILPGAGIDKPESTPSASPSRADLGLPGKDFLLLSFGVQREDKGILELLGCMRSAPGGVHLLVAGEDWTDGKITAAVKRFHIEDRVSLHLRYFSDDEMNAVFRAADAVVVCHRPGFQGESGILFHAIAHRKPILASAPGHTADLVRQKGLGCAFEFGDSNSFHAAVQRLLAGTEIERASRSRALDQSAHALSWTAVSEKYFAVYSSLLSLPAGVGNA